MRVEVVAAVDDADEMLAMREDPLDAPSEDFALVLGEPGLCDTRACLQVEYGVTDERLRQSIGVAANLRTLRHDDSLRSTLHQASTEDADNFMPATGAPPWRARSES
jgi:hypothetical protein